jgi:hypothetical protein
VSLGAGVVAGGVAGAGVEAAGGEAGVVAGGVCARAAPAKMRDTASTEPSPVAEKDRDERGARRIIRLSRDSLFRRFLS